MIREKPKCFGSKRCALGPNNRNRWLCSRYRKCNEALILNELDRGKAPHEIMHSLQRIIGDSDYLILKRVGGIATRNGFHFGRKKVDRAIGESEIDQDGEIASFEKSDIRKAFGVYGRPPITPRKNGAIGQTAEVDFAHNAQTEPLSIDSILEA